MKLHIQEDGYTCATLAKDDRNLSIHVDKRINASLLFTYGEGRELHSDILVEEGASFTLLMKHDGSVDSSLQQRSEVQKDAELHLAYCELDQGNATIDSTVRLLDKGASAFIRSATIASGNKSFHIRCEHQSPYTRGEMENYAVVQEGAVYRMEAIGKIVKGAKESASHQTTRVLTMSEKQTSEVTPILLIDENQVKASHATTLGQPDENQLYYLQTRGLSRDMAMGLLTLGYLMPITKLLHDDKIQKELQNEIEMKVGLHV